MTMSVLGCKDPNANESLNIVKDKIVSIGVTGFGSAFSIYAVVLGSTTPVTVKDGYTTKALALAALETYLNIDEVEVIN